MEKDGSTVLDWHNDISSDLSYDAFESVQHPLKKAYLLCLQIVLNIMSKRVDAIIPRDPKISFGFRLRLSKAQRLPFLLFFQGKSIRLAWSAYLAI